MSETLWIKIAPQCGIATTAGDKYAGEHVELPAAEAREYVASTRAIFVDGPAPIAAESADPAAPRKR